MQPSLRAGLLERRFRLNSIFRVVPIAELTAEMRGRLGGVEGGGELAAVLLPSAPGLSAKAICAETAGLLETLQAPAALSPRLREHPGAAELLLRLVLDTVLEVEDGGRFVSGPSTADLLKLAPAISGSGETARLSEEALLHAEALPVDEGPALSTRLYFYNRVPVSPRWTERLGTPEKLAAWLGLTPGSALTQRLERDWIEVSSPPDNLSWRHFRCPGAGRGAPFKLYLNPHADFVREVLEAALPLLASFGFSSFKLGRDLQGVLRPDKLVAYAHSRAQIDGVAQGLMRRLRGLPAQAVPFTAALDETGLLSWGMDPPRSENVSSWQGTSWRRWITDRLAGAVLAGRASEVASPARFALQRLELEGIDARSWTPNRVDWAQEAPR